MSSFYSNLAKEIEEDADKNGHMRLDSDEDLEDILDAIEKKEVKFPQKTASKSHSTINRFDSVKEPTEQRGTVKNKNNHENARINPRKNVLNALIDPLEINNDFDSKPNKDDEGLRLTNGNVGSSGKNFSTASRRSVRFSDDINSSPFDYGEDKNTLNLNQERKKLDSKSSENFEAFPNFVKNQSSEEKNPLDDKIERTIQNSTRPQTAPGSSENRKLNFNDLFTNENEFLKQDFNPLIDNSLVDSSKTSKNPRSYSRRPASLDSISRSSLNKFHMDQSFVEAKIENKQTIENIEFEIKTKRLEMERDNLVNLFELMRKQHNEEIRILEQTNHTKLELLEESAKRREKRLKEEIEFLENQNHERLIQIEQKRDQLCTDLNNKLNESRQLHSNELMELRKSHELQLETLKQQNQELVDRMKSASQLEIRTLTELQPNTDQFKLLLEQIKSVLNDLNRSEQDQIRNLNLRQEQLNRREDLIRNNEERLIQKENSIEQERKQLIDLITKLEIQLRENNKLATDDRWSIKQEQNRLSKLQIELEEERKSMVEHCGRERSEMQHIVSNFLSEYRKTQVKHTEERNVLIEEQQRLRTDQLAWEEKRQNEEQNLKKLKEELDTMKDCLTTERRRLDERTNCLRIDEVKLDETRRQLDIVRCDLTREQEILTHREEFIEQKSEELNKRTDSINQAEKLLKEAETRHRRLQDEQSKQFSELQERSQQIHEAEKNLAHERKELLLQLEELNRRQKDHKRNFLCTNCRTPVRENFSENLKLHHKLNTNGINLNKRLTNTIKSNGVNDGSSTAGDGSWTSFRQLRASQNQDARYLQEENRYLESIKDLSIPNNYTT